MRNHCSTLGNALATRPAASSESNASAQGPSAGAGLRGQQHGQAGVGDLVGHGIAVTHAAIGQGEGHAQAVGRKLRAG